MIFIIFSLIFSGIILLIDRILRNKKYVENTKEEKTGLILTFIFSFPYVFGSFFGTLIGKLPYREGEYQELIVNAFTIAGYSISFICLICIILFLVFRKIGKAELANKSLIAGFIYCVLVIFSSFLF